MKNLRNLLALTVILFTTEKDILIKLNKKPKFPSSNSKKHFLEAS
mgnify:CR=1 FL=1